MTGKPKMGEDRAAELVVAIAKRVQRNHPDAEPIGILVAAAATLFLAGFTDPKDRHVLHAAGRMRDRLASEETPAPAGPEVRNLNERQQAILEGLRPTWEEIRRRLSASIPGSTWNLWLEPLVLCGLRETTLLVTAPEGIRAWCERRYANLIAEVAGEVAGGRITAIRFVNWVPFGEPKCDSPNGSGTEPQPPTTGGQQ